MLFDNVTVRLLSSDDFPAQARRQAAEELTRAARESALQVEIAPPLPLAQIAAAHEIVDAGTRARVLLAVER